MNNLIIIGNGFDLGHNLPTHFDNFIKSASIYEKKYSIFKNDQNSWRDIENKYKELVVEIIKQNNEEVFVADLLEEIIESYGTDEFGEINYYDYKPDSFKQIISEISQMVCLLTNFEADFLSYLQHECNDTFIKTHCQPRKKLVSIFNAATKVINFNYTNVIEILYKFNNVEHIHGNINDNIAIGCDTFDRLDVTTVHDDYPTVGLNGHPKDILIEKMRYYEYDLEGNLIEKEPINRFFNNMVEKNRNNEDELYNLLKTKSKEFMEQRIEITENLKAQFFDEVHIIGHSLGEADWSIFNSIMAKKIICYYHDHKDYSTKKQIINKNGWKILLEPDNTLFI